MPEPVCVHPVAYEGPCRHVMGRGSTHWHCGYPKIHGFHTGDTPDFHPYRGAAVLCGHAESVHLDPAIDLGLPYGPVCQECEHSHAFDSGERVGATTDASEGDES